MRELNPDGTTRRLVRVSAKCQCGGKSDVFIQEFTEVTVCLVCGIRAGKVNDRMIDVGIRNFPEPNQIKVTRMDGKNAREKKRRNAITL